MSDDLAAMDEWCKARSDRLTKRSSLHIMSGRSINDPAYRAMLGEQRAYMAMRSFIHGTRRSIK